MSDARLTRRQFLTTAAAGTAALTLPATARADSPPTPPSDPNADGFSFVHLTDMHVARRRKGHEGYLRCIESVNALPVKPAFAIMGGDLAFDGLYNEKDEFADQIKLYKDVTAELDCPHHNCMGNHDVLGWNSRRKVPTDDPDLGKRMIMDRLEWEKPYYSFDHGRWHFAILDSIYPITQDHGPSYEPRIGEEQLEWLAYDLGAAGDRPKVVVTHIAAFCNKGQQAGDPHAPAMTPGMVVRDNRALRRVLERHGVKALLQGHSHRPEEYRFQDVWYLTSGAVSAAWWSGDWIGATTGYTVFHCAGDELGWQMRAFEWEPHLEPRDTLERRKIAEHEAELAEQRRLLERERAGRRPS